MTNEQKERANAVFDKLIDQRPYLADHINDQRNEFMSQKIGSNSKEHLKQIIEKIQRLKDQQKEISEEIKDIFKESKSAGFDNKIVKKLIPKRSKRYRLPDWKDLLGIAPEATGGLSSEEFIRNLRNEWQ